MKLKKGQSLIDEEKRLHPENLIPHFLENYIDFFVLFFNEDPVEYKTLIRNLEKRIDLMNTGPENSPYFLFTKSVIHFQWAAVRIKFGYRWEAGWQLRRAYLQIKDNMRAFPSFLPNLVFNGAMQVAVGTIPEGYKWLGNLFGLKGSIKGGMEQLRAFLESRNEIASLFRDEASFYYLNLLPRLTALENVALPLVYAGMSKKMRNDVAREVVKKVGLEDRSHHKPNELSGGQCQRVAIARALVNNPSLILADEPTGNLDSKTSIEIMEIFNKIHEGGNTVVLVTHEEDIANYARRVVRLRDGVIETDKRRSEFAVHA